LGNNKILLQAQILNLEMKVSQYLEKSTNNKIKNADGFKISFEKFEKEEKYKVGKQQEEEISF